MSIQSTSNDEPAADVTPWGAVACMSLMTFVLVASEFMPVSLLTPIASDLAITQGQAGQAISFSGLFGVTTSLFGNAILGGLDRRNAILLYTAMLVISGLTITFGQNYLTFMIGRALVGIAIGGFWSLSTAILGRIVPRRDLAKAIAMLQSGTALAFLVAPPLASFLGALIGWRGAFFTVVPIGVAALVWQVLAFHKMPAQTAASIGTTIKLLAGWPFNIGMLATTLVYMGQFGLSTYLRPFLEGVTRLDDRTLPIYLLTLGIAGFAGTSLSSGLIHAHLQRALVGMPLVLTLTAVSFILFGWSAPATAALLVIWGLLTTPIPVAWNTWMTKVVPGDLEAAGGLQVALIQFAITSSAFVGGALFDSVGWRGPFVLAAFLMLGATVISRIVARASGNIGS